MTYNYFGKWSKRTGQHSGLYASSKDSVYERTYLNTDASIQSWVRAGTQKDKLLMGIPFFGRSFTLTDPQDHELHAPVTGSGDRSAPTYSQVGSYYNYCSYFFT